MEKTLSKHGKYWIITGTPEELYDEMQPGDLVKTSKGTWWELSHHVDIEDLPLSLRIVAELYDPDSIWLEKDTESGEEGYLAAYRKDFVLKIKRPVAVNTMLGNYTLLGTLTGDATFTEKPETKKEEPEATKQEPEQEKKTLPEEKGFYEDPDGDLWYIDPDESEPKYYWFGLSCYWLDSSTDKSYGGYRRWLQLHEMSVQQAKKYGPYRRVTRIRWETN